MYWIPLILIALIVLIVCYVIRDLAKVTRYPVSPETRPGNASDQSGKTPAKPSPADLRKPGTYRDDTPPLA